jgi:hypothetical protein
MYLVGEPPLADPAQLSKLVAKCKWIFFLFVYLYEKRNAVNIYELVTVLGWNHRFLPWKLYRAGKVIKGSLVFEGLLWYLGGTTCSSLWIFSVN